MEYLSDWMNVRLSDNLLSLPGFMRVWTAILLFIGIALAVMAYVAVRNLAIPSHPKLTNHHAVRSLEEALGNYMEEYGRLPTSSSHSETDGKEGRGLLAVLLGMETESPEKKNPRTIKFLSVKEGSGRKDGLIYDGAYRHVEELFDGWGRPYVLETDVSNTGILRFKYGSRVVELPGKSVAVYSTGADGNAGTWDDIRSWSK